MKPLSEGRRTRPEPKLRTSGLFCGFIFLGGAVLNIVTGLVSGETVRELLSEYVLVHSVLAFSAILFVAALVERLAWIQPLVFLTLTAVNVLNTRDSFYGLGFYAIAMLLLIKLGFFDKRRLPRILICLAYLMAVELASVIKNKEPIAVSILPVFFIVAFFTFILMTFRDRILVFLKEPKPLLSLEGKGLSAAERTYVRAVIDGKEVKQAAFESGVSESTVRNTLARAYKKLEVANRSGLLALAQKFEIS